MDTVLLCAWCSSTQAFLLDRRCAWHGCYRCVPFLRTKKNMRVGKYESKLLPIVVWRAVYHYFTTIIKILTIDASVFGSCSKFSNAQKTKKLAVPDRPPLWQANRKGFGVVQKSRPNLPVPALGVKETGFMPSISAYGFSKIYLGKSYGIWKVDLLLSSVLYLFLHITIIHRHVYNYNMYAHTHPHIYIYIIKICV